MALAILFFSLVCSSFIQAGPVPQKGWRDTFQMGVLTPAPVAASLNPSPTRRKRYVLISGLFSDVTGGSYAATQQTLLEAGVPKEDIIQLTVSSVQSVAANIAQTHQMIANALNGDFSTETVFVGHSLGAVSLWGAVLTNTDFYESFASHLIFMQGPFQGSPMASGARGAADYVASSTKELSGWQGWLGLAASYLASSAASAVTDKLKPEEVAVEISRLQKAHLTRVKRALSDHLLFLVTSFPATAALSTEGANAGWAQAACSLAIQYFGYGDSDSVVPAASQFPEGLPLDFRRVISGFHHNSFTGTPEGGAALGRALLLL